MRRLFVSLVTALAALPLSCLAAGAEPRHAIAMHGEPALKADFDHFPYANPQAPKGGAINYAWTGTFDSINPFIVQGSGARGSIDLLYGNNVFDTLMMRSADEPFSLYPLLARTIETDDERSFAEFTIDDRAKFSDGQPVTADDVIFTFNLLRDKGIPRYGITAKKIASVEKVGTQGIRFTFKEPDRELPLILGLLPILPKHAIDAETFDKSTLRPLMGSGPYTLDRVRAGDSLTFKRNPDYWAKDIPSKRGFDNYDQITLTYYRDENALFEGLKKGLIDVFVEQNSGRWNSQYNFPAVERGDIVRETLKTQLPSGMFGIVMNTRKPVFKDRAVREAMTDLLDFEWVNRTLFNGAYTRTRSFYDNSEMSTYGQPASEAEQALLAPFPDAVTPAILENGWAPPVSDGTGTDRKFLRFAFDKLKAAGFSLKDGVMSGPDGQPLTFEIMLKADENQQVALAFQQTAKKIGVTVNIRSVDSAQFIQRQSTYNFDAMFFNYPASLSPGVEQVARWGSQSYDPPGTFNYAGVSNPAVDAVITALLNARERSDFVQAVRALDRVLLSGSYVVPLYFRPEQWIARWKRIERPETIPLQGAQLPTWWHAQN
jgi:peptide/nickel transport system substrate-binding protein